MITVGQTSGEVYSAAAKEKKLTMMELPLYRV